VTRVLSFSDEAVGQVYVVVEGTQPSPLTAQGEVDVPPGAKAYLLLDESADPALPFLEGLDGDVVVMLQAKAVDAEGVARLATQTAVQQLSLGSPLTDETLVALGGCAAQQLDVTLDGPAGDGVAGLSGVAGLRLHGDPGSVLGTLARSTTLTYLHFHADSLGLAQLRDLATATHLETLDVEVESMVDGSEADVVDALVAVASGLKSLSIQDADGASAIPSAVQVAILRSCEGLSLNGATYTPAAVARLERKLAPA
jgi:hypothetical protein